MPPPPPLPPHLLQIGLECMHAPQEVLTPRLQLLEPGHRFTQVASGGLLGCSCPPLQRRNLGLLQMQQVDD